MMANYAILRDMDPTWTRADVDAGAVQTLFNMRLGRRYPELAWEPRMIEVDWVRSFWQEGTNWGLCLYTAPESQQIADYHSLCGVPYVEYHEIEEHFSPELCDPESGDMMLSDSTVTLFTVELALDVDEVGVATFERIEALLGSAAEPIPTLVEGPTDHIQWIRAYWDRTRRVAVAFYAVENESALRFLEELFDGSDVAVRPVVEITPAEYLDE